MSESFLSCRLNVSAVLCGVWLFGACSEAREAGLRASIDALLVTHCQTIKVSAASFGLPTVVVGGVVATEQALNLNTVDRVQDAVFRRLLRDKPSEWWSEWRASNEALEARVASSRLIGNKDRKSVV